MPCPAGDVNAQMRQASCSHAADQERIRHWHAHSVQGEPRTDSVRPGPHCAADLHLDGVPLLERAVQDAGRVNDLPAQVSVVHVPYKETFCREGVRLHLHVRSRHLRAGDETALANALCRLRLESPHDLPRIS